MSGKSDIKKVVPAEHDSFDDAVGVPDARWYVAVVNSRAEKSVQEKLEKIGYETYVATQTMFRIRKNGRKSKVEKVLIPSRVFIKCNELQRRKEIVTLPYINRFMTNLAGASAVVASRKPLAVIPQVQIDKLRFMLGQSDIPVSFTDTHYRQHDKIRVVRGKLQGLEGEVVMSEDGKSEVIIRVDLFGCATLQINTSDIELLP